MQARYFLNPNGFYNHQTIVTQVKCNGYLPHGVPQRLIENQGKWCNDGAVNSQIKAYIMFTFNKPIDIGGYCLVSANDYESRDPDSFKLFASKDPPSPNIQINNYDSIENFF